ncbi:MAG: nitroreductase family protein [Coriobacteriia bacterium]|nr:nitroreductase family protein [Coriobacteriia bacterium]
MDIIEAIETRISCRAFTKDGINQETFDALAAEIEALNAESGLHFQLYGPRADGTAIDMQRKMFAANPPAYAALVAQKGPLPEEMLGYYGEKLVLKATQLGLGTCWVASTYDRSTTRVELAPGEKLHDVVPIGYAPEKMPLLQRTIRGRIRGRSKPNEQLYRGPQPLAQAPEWIQAAIQAVQLAPSAICEQPVVFVQDDPDTPIRATLPQIRTKMEYTDLGIAKLHFQIAAAECGVQGTWEWGEGGAFIR